MRLLFKFQAEGVALQKTVSHHIARYQGGNSYSRELVMFHKKAGPQISDTEIQSWAERHDIRLSITNLREAYEDARTFKTEGL